MAAWRRRRALVAACAAVAAHTAPAPAGERENVPTYEPCPSAAARSPARGLVACVRAAAAADFLALLRTQRALGLLLPAEAFHNGELSAELGGWIAAQDRGVAVRDTGLPRDAGWWCKPAALLRSAFTEVLLVDVDIAPMISLEALFRTEPYARTGTLFFRDMVKRYGPLKRSFLRRELCSFDSAPYARWPAHTANGAPRECPSAQLRASLAWSTRMNNEAESSVLLFDRCRQARAAAVLHAEREQLGRHSHGDKEVYWLAAELAGSEYAFSPLGVGAWGLPEAGLGGAGNETWVCNSMLAQFHPETGALAWLHGEKRNQWLARTHVARGGTRGERAPWTRLPRERPLSARLEWSSRDCAPRAGWPLRPEHVQLLRARVAAHADVLRAANAAGVRLPDRHDSHGPQHDGDGPPDV